MMFRLSIMFLLNIFAISFLVPLVYSHEFKVVNTESGAVRGKSATTLWEEKPYYLFKGVPFAEPPVKKLRFKVSLFY